MFNKRTLIITSISSPNKILKLYAKICEKNKIEFIIIGDKASPRDFKLDGCYFWSLQNQKKLPFSVASLLPEKHYSRKNIGYLLAIKGESEIIMETDDDNAPYDSFVDPKDRYVKACFIEEKGWVNIYKYFTNKKIWPRGFPLEYLKNHSVNFSKLESLKINCPIQQGLADENPDVDAIFRLTGQLPIFFDKKIKVSIGRNTVCPFNSQNTIWFKEVFPLLYLPSYCSFRMTDIWRSFIAQRILWENKWNVLFESPTVCQKRNKHNLLNDFEDEIPGYLNNDKIVKILSKLKLKSGTKYIGENLVKCYEGLVRQKMIDSREIKILNAWLFDLSVL